MPSNFPRARRVGEQIRQELAEILMREMKDPRVHGVTITAVEVTRDLEHAKIYYTRMGGQSADTQKVLARAAGYLRSELSHRMRLRVVPILVFQYDESVERGAHLSELIDKAVAEDRKHHHDDE